MKNTFYTGIWHKYHYDKIWKNNNLIEGIFTNATTDFDDALNFSGDELIVVKIDNVPISAIIGIRKNNYKNDDDWKDITHLSDTEKQNLYDKGGMFLLNLFPCKDHIQISLKNNGLSS